MCKANIQRTILNIRIVRASIYESRINGLSAASPLDWDICGTAQLFPLNLIATFENRLEVIQVTIYPHPRWTIPPSVITIAVFKTHDEKKFRIMICCVCSA